MSDELLHHFSEDPSITHFIPHVPATNPAQKPAVWAIDAEHAPLYWFPRHCPRATAWPRTRNEHADFRRVLATAADRLHAIEANWLKAMQTVELFRYDFHIDDFDPWSEASGQWISSRTVEPVSVAPVGDLIEAHIDAEIELRLVTNLWAVADLMNDDRWDFSLVRMANAKTTQDGSVPADHTR